MIAVSIVIPVRHDSAALQRLLTLLPALDGFDNAVDVSIAASPVDDALRGLATQHGARLIDCPTGRGNQLNTAAESAEGRILWFLHADAKPDRGALSEIRNSCQNGAEGGYLRFAFDGVPTKAKQRLAALINWRARHGVAYGDQGLFFVAPVFRELGGFSEDPLFEEVRLVKAIKRRGQFRALDAVIRVDTRRWETDGWVKRTLLNRLLALGHASGIPASTLARWYEGRRKATNVPQSD